MSFLSELMSRFGLLPHERGTAAYPPGLPTPTTPVPDGPSTPPPFIERFALSTRWNCERHHDGEEMVAEIRGAGFTRVELGYDLTLPLVPGLRKTLEAGSISVTSVHNYCPVPVGAPAGHPELFSLASTNERTRSSAVLHTERTVAFAGEVGARVVVLHAGQTEMSRFTPRLLTLCEAGRPFSARFDRTRARLIAARDKVATAHLENLYRSIEELLPAAEKNGVVLAFENLPHWEAIPTEMEMEAILKRFDTPRLAMWYDTGHGQVRENLGFISQRVWVPRLAPRIAGLHLHDVIPPAFDHVMPPRGGMDFSVFRALADSGICLVLEPLPGVPVAELHAAVAALSRAWTWTRAEPDAPAAPNAAG